MEIEKIGTSEWITIRSHARRLYLPLSADLIQVFGLKGGDRLKVKIEEVQREVKGRVRMKIEEGGKEA